MVKNYGLPYKGSKNKIAERIINLLPAGGTLYDLFAGGCAVTHCAMLSGKWDKYVINDLKPGQTQFFIDAINGKFKDRYEWISREDFYRLKDSDPFVRTVFSFGNDGRTYLCSPEKERIKGLAHKMLTAETVHERRMLYRKFMLELKRSGYVANTQRQNVAQLRTLESLERIQSLQSPQRIKRLDKLEELERLQRLQSLHSLQSIKRLHAFSGDYQEIPLEEPGVIYCDIPYRGTEQYGPKGFDYERFYSWCERQTLPVFISELQMPEDRFVSIAEFKINHCINAKEVTPVTEKVFIPRTQLTRESGVAL